VTAPAGGLSFLFEVRAITTRTRAGNRGHRRGGPRAPRSLASAAQYVTSRAADASNPVTQRSGAAESNGRSHTQRNHVDRPSPEREMPPTSCRIATGTSALIVKHDAFEMDDQRKRHLAGPVASGA
jgi:hypothetical protein